MLYGLEENFTLNFIEILSKPSLSIYQMIHFINHCNRILDVTVFALLIKTSFKLIHDIDRVYLSIGPTALANGIAPRSQPLILFLI